MWDSRANFSSPNCEGFHYQAIYPLLIFSWQ